MRRHPTKYTASHFEHMLWNYSLHVAFPPECVHNLRRPAHPIRLVISRVPSIVLLLGISLAVVQADQPIILPLWPGDVPGAMDSEEKDIPKLLVYHPSSDQPRAATAVVVVPGGGYGHLAIDHEGHQVAQWMNQLGITAAILDYRHAGKGYQHPIPMQDAQRAIRLARTSADNWNVRSDQIGILGFSAGGHLAATAATHFDAGHEQASDEIDRVSCRPDFLVLCYPVIALGQPYTHLGSQQNLLGEHPAAELLREWSAHEAVRADTPATFLWHTSTDTAVPPQNSIDFYQALVRAGVAAELHIFANGRHGLGLASGEAGAERWPQLCADWMRARHLIP